MEGGLGTGYYKLEPLPVPEFKHLVPVGKLPSRSVPVAVSGPNYTVKMCPEFAAFVDENIVDCSPVYAKSDCERVRPVLADLKASIAKCDVPCVTPSVNDPAYFHAMELAWQMLKDDLTVTLDIDPKRLSEFNLSASAGYPYTSYGFRDKASAFESPIFKDLVSRLDYIPLDTVNSKDEFLTLSDLARHKLRTTFGAPLDKVCKQKFLFDQQNANIIKSSTRKWIQYGMTKQYGGFHRVVQALENFTHVVQSDASGWDRVAYLEPVYDLRLRGLKYPDVFQDFVNDTVFHTVHPTILLPDGSVYIRVTGNDSGGNNTASDNSILHLVIVLHLLVVAFYRKYAEYPCLDDILYNALVYLYSDDKLGGINLEYFGLDTESFASLETEIYALYGMVIKPSSVLVTKVVNHVHPDHEFLGSFCVFDPDTARYIPYPRIGKVCASITRVGLNNELTPVEHFMKVLQLTLLSYKDDVVFDVLSHYVHYLIHKSSNDPAFVEVLSANSLDSFTPRKVLSYHLGWEQRPELSADEPDESGDRLSFSYSSLNLMSDVPPGGVLGNFSC